MATNDYHPANHIQLDWKVDEMFYIGTTPVCFDCITDEELADIEDGD